jgi:hypothetical protein
MAENGTVAVPQQQTGQGAAPQQQQVAGQGAAGQQHASQCSGNCKQCSLFQRQYCASQLALTNMRMMERMVQQLQKMQMHLDDIDRKVEAMQNNEASLIEPNIAQQGDGAVK